MPNGGWMGAAVVEDIGKATAIIGAVVATVGLVIYAGAKASGGP